MLGNADMWRFIKMLPTEHLPDAFLVTKVMPKTLPPNSRSPSSIVKLYLASKWSIILVYIQPQTWPGRSILILVSLNALSYPFLSEGSTQWTFDKFLLWRIVSACAIPELLSKEFVSFEKCIRMLWTSSGVAYTHICKVLISQHFNSCTRLSTLIINDPLNPLQPCLANSLSTSNTQSFFSTPAM